MEQRVADLVLFDNPLSLALGRNADRLVAIFTAFLCACANGYDGLAPVPIELNEILTDICL